MATNDPLAPSDRSQALGRIPSGLYILTLVPEGSPDGTGMLASWVMQAGFDPPMLSLALKQGRYVTDAVAEGRPLVLNVVGESQGALLKHFGKGFEPGEPAFEGLTIEQADNGAPGLVDALARIECVAEQGFDSGDHRVFLARVTGGQLQGKEKPKVHLRNRGDHY